MAGIALHITTTLTPRHKSSVIATWFPLDLPQMTPRKPSSLPTASLPDSQKHRFEEALELDFSFGLKGLARFRGKTSSRSGERRLGRFPFEFR